MTNIITFSCAQNRSNVGESTCKKGILKNPSQIMRVDENFTFTLAQSNDVTFWEAAVKNKEAVLFPKIYNFENANIEAAYDETNFGVGKSSQGKYGFRLFFKENRNVNRNMYTWDGSTDRIILFDDQGAMMSTLVGGEQADPADNTYTGLRPQLFSVENEMIADGAPTQLPIRLLFESAAEWNVRGYIFEQDVLSQIKSLSTVNLDITGLTSTATGVQVRVLSVNDGSPVRGLLETDFTFSTGSFTGITEDEDGVYTLIGVGLTTGNLDLVTPPNCSQFLESSGLIAITI